MAARRKILRLKKLGICLSGTIIAPVFAFFIARCAPVITSAAIFCAGLNMPDGAALAIAKSKEAPAVQETSVPITDTAAVESKQSVPAGEVIMPTSTGEGNRDGKIIYKTFGKMSSEAYINLSAGQIKNCTSVPNATVAAEAAKLPEFTITANSEPQVLIYHTHATESFEPCERDYFDASYPTRSTDKSKNMVAVGSAITEELEACGIGVIHMDTLHDEASYTGSYARSAETIKSVLAEYPSIKVVLDVHRDAIESDGVRTAAVTSVNGQNAAQVMIISGCDDGTMNMPNYMQNLRLASLFQQQIENDYPSLTRPVLFDYRKYNQDLSTGGLLLEFGSHANTLEQAVYSGHLVGKSIAKALLSLRH